MSKSRIGHSLYDLITEERSSEIRAGLTPGNILITTVGCKGLPVTVYNTNAEEFISPDKFKDVSSYESYPNLSHDTKAKCLGIVIKPDKMVGSLFIDSVTGYCDGFKWSRGGELDKKILGRNKYSEDEGEKNTSKIQYCMYRDEDYLSINNDCLVSLIGRLDFERIRAYRDCDKVRYTLSPYVPSINELYEYFMSMKLSYDNGLMKGLVNNNLICDEYFKYLEYIPNGIGRLNKVRNRLKSVARSLTHDNSSRKLLRIWSSTQINDNSVYSLLIWNDGSMEIESTDKCILGKAIVFYDIYRERI